MNIDKFGRGTFPVGGHPNQSIPINRPQGLPKTSDGNYDVETLRLHNVGSPLYAKDASTKQYVDEVSDVIRKQLNILNESVRTVENRVEKCTNTLQRLDTDFKKIETDFDSYRDSVNRSNQNFRTDFSSKYESTLKSYAENLQSLQEHVLRMEKELINIVSSSAENLQDAGRAYVLETKQALEDIKLHLTQGSSQAGS